MYCAWKGAKKFLGGTFEVLSMGDLEKAAFLPTAFTIREMKDAPGGGYVVALQDPEGFPINLTYGQTPSSSRDLPQKIILNNEKDNPRARKFYRFSPGPAAVHKLGHYGLCVQNFDKQLERHTRNFNLGPTDFLYVPLQNADVKGAPAECNKLERKERKDVAVFAHIDRGDTPVDHHTFFLSSNVTNHVHHCSFEVHNYDTQHLGHQWLGQRGYTSVWGIGRHVLGSQIFVRAVGLDDEFGR